MPNAHEWNRCFVKLEAIIKHPLSEVQKSNLLVYVEHLLKWNKTYNLIGPSTVETILDRHIVDSAPLLPLLSKSAEPSNSVTKVADIGSGAGFPGLLLAILSASDLQIDLIESAGKKARFLSYMVNKLALNKRCRVFAERAEKIALTKNCEYHFVVSRAVGTLSLLARLSCGLLQTEGCCLALKGERAEQEIVDFSASKESKFFAEPVIIPITGIPGARIVSLKKVSRETC